MLLGGHSIAKNLLRSGQRLSSGYDFEATAEKGFAKKYFRRFVDLILTAALAR